MNFIPVIRVLGVLNIIMVTLLFSSCRCIPGSKLFSKIMERPAYKRYYKYHCYLWWVFWPSVIVHAILAISVYGWGVF